MDLVLDPILNHLVGILLALLLGFGSYGLKKLSDYLGSKGLDINMKVFEDYFMANIFPQVESQLDELAGKVDTIDDLPDSLVTQIAQKLVNKAPELLKGMGLTKGYFKKEVNYDKVVDYVKDKLFSLIGD